MSSCTTIRKKELTNPVCPGSINSIQGAIGSVCEAVDKVMASNAEALQRAFVAIRPPGHHCGEDTPSGFCFVNNVAIGAAHGMFSYPISCQLSNPRQHTSVMGSSEWSFLTSTFTTVCIVHGIQDWDYEYDRGNGTQSIVWQINEETYRQSLENEGFMPNAEAGLQVFYGSIHDVLSYPCEVRLHLDSSRSSLTSFRTVN